MYDFKGLDRKQHGTSEFPCEYYYVDSSHPRYQMPSHWHKEWEILRVVKGNFQIRIDRELFSASEGDIFLIHSGAVHGGIPNECVYECFVFDLYGFFRSIDFVKKHLRPFYRGTVTPQCFLKKGESQKIESITSALMSSFENNTAELDVLTGISGLFSQIITEKRFKENESEEFSANNRIEQIKSVLEFIEENYSSAITLRDLACASNMNPKYFCRVFSSLTHQSPMDYVNFYRIEKAAFLLETTDLSITTIGLECGFSESSYFTKVFKKYKNTTPRQYRKRS